MKRTVVAIVLTAMLISLPALVYAAPTTNVLDGGVCINEILIDPNSTPANFDTDGNGTAADQDEFVELYNLSGSAIDISGWQLWDAGQLNWFTFPGGTVLEAGAYAVVVVAVQSGGSLPTMTNPNSLAFDAAWGSSVINNGGDNVVLYDPGADEYIQLRYNGDAADNPPAAYPGFSATATLVGSAEDWGSDVDGYSITRYPSGDDVVGVHNAVTPGGTQASPNRVTVSNLAGVSSPSLSLVAAAILSGSLIIQRKRK